MKRFEAVSAGDTDFDRFTQWLMVISHKAIADKDRIRRICEAKGEVMDAIKAITRLSGNKITRQSYQRRMDQIYFYNKAMAEKDAKIADKDAEIADKDAALADKDAVIADRDAALADKDAVIADKDAALTDKDAVIADRDTALADKDAVIADRDATLADKDAIIARLKAQLGESE